MIINKNLIRILSLLNKVDSLCVYDIVEELKVSQPLVSKRLKALRNLQLVRIKSKDEFNRVFYELNPKYRDNAVYHLICAYEDLLF